MELLDIKNIYLNSQEIIKIYLKDQVIFGGSQEPPTLSFKNTTHWVKGLKNIPIPDKQHWGIAWEARFDGDTQISSERIGLEWTPNMGWYDCTKIFPEDGDHSIPENKDSNLCWAAVTSNLVHWWLDQNKDNIDQYGKYTNGPKVYTDALHSEVFDYFKNRFTNEGSFIESGLNWFFFNKYPSGNSNMASLNMLGREHKGFFTDVVGENGFFNTNLYRPTYGSNLNEDLKKAFTQGEAIGLSILTTGGKGGHALTVWGAHFNENEVVDKLYVCENNDTFNFKDEENLRPTPMEPGKLCRQGIYEHKVKQLENGRWALEAGAYEVYTMIVDKVVYLNDGHQQWEKYFNTLK